jgi:uncharacterized surface protein with fasciclin (FAS1) repeats
MAPAQIVTLAALVASASAFAPGAVPTRSTAIFSGPEIGAGGMADTRNPEAQENEDPRKSISAAPSFEEYLKQRAGGDAAAAAAPATSAAPAAAGGVVSTLKDLEGPGQVWGADGIAVGKEESDLKGYENFGKFYEALTSTGVAAELTSGPYTIFAPTDPAFESYELMRGTFDADIVKMHIVPGKIASSDVPTADLTTIGGTTLSYRYAVRKHFVNDVIIGEKTFGPFSDYPMDVECDDGLIHTIGVCFAM